MSEEQISKKKPIYTKWWFWLIIIVIILAALGNGFSSNTTQNETSNLTNENVTSNISTLSGTIAKDYFNILCEVAGMHSNEPQIIDNEIIYESTNQDYNIKIVADKTSDEIENIKITTFKENDYENFFLAISRLEYSGSNRSTLFNWINDNLGKESNTSIGNANFSLYLTDTNNPILDVSVND